MTDTALPTMTPLVVPSAEFWTITPFTMTVPEAWTAKQTVDHLVYATSPDGGSTIAVRWQRVPAGLGLVASTDVHVANIRRADGDAKLVEAKPGKLNGVKSLMRVTEFSTAERPVAQLYLALHGPKFGDDQPIELFELVAHIPQGDTDAFREALAICSSFRFTLQRNEEA